MVINYNWVLEYIRNNPVDGKTLRIVIPKEATAIETAAFNFYYMSWNNQNFKFNHFIIEFEKGCQIRRIPDSTFSTSLYGGIPITIEITNGESLKEIDEKAFEGIGHVILDDNLQLEVCKSSAPFIGAKDINVSPSLRILKIDSAVDCIQALTIPPDSNLESVVTENGINKIVLPSGQEINSEDGNILRGIRFRNNKALIIFANEKNGSQKYLILDLEHQRLEYARKFCDFRAKYL